MKRLLCAAGIFCLAAFADADFGGAGVSGAWEPSHTLTIYGREAYGNLSYNSGWYAGSYPPMYAIGTIEEVKR